VNAPLREFVVHREEVLGRVRQLLITKLRVRRAPEEIDPDTPLFGTGLGLDSIDAVDLAVSLDTDFGVRLPDEIGGRAALRTVNNIVDVILAQERRAADA
jgi:acyl carrier protein